MSKNSIPTALDPQGTHVPIEEAIDKLDYYRCPECGEFVTPRIGPQRQYFAHRRGVLEDIDCSLASDARQVTEELRESDIEKEENNRHIRTYLGERRGKRMDYFGVIRSLEWTDLLPNDDVDELLAATEIQTEGIIKPPVPANFHPTESEVICRIDPTADSIVVDIDGPPALKPITGTWTTDPLGDGDVFVGDQRRARRHADNRQVKQGEWVYIATSDLPDSLPSVATTDEVGGLHLIGIPAREETESLLEQYGGDLTTDQYGFDADVILPAHSHPTEEAPIIAEPSNDALIGIRPDEEIDPIFEIVSIPKTNSQVEIKPTGPGNPRFYSTEIPRDGSQRVSVHQKNSSRHRLVHLHATQSDETPHHQSPASVQPQIGFTYSTDDSEVFLSPVNGQRSYTVDPNTDPATLPDRIDYVGPEGLTFDIRLRIQDDNTSTFRSRLGVEMEDIRDEIYHWVVDGCEMIKIVLDTLGTVTLEFPQPALKGTY